MNRELKTAIHMYKLARDQAGRPEGRTAHFILQKIMRLHGISMPDILQEVRHSVGSYRIEAPVELATWETHVQLARLLGHKVALVRSGDLELQGSGIGHVLSVASPILKHLEWVRRSPSWGFIFTLPVVPGPYPELLYQFGTREEVLTALLFTKFLRLQQQTARRTALPGPSEWGAPGVGGGARVESPRSRPMGASDWDAVPPERPAPACSNPRPSSGKAPAADWGAATAGSSLPPPPPPPPPLPPSAIQMQMSESRNCAVQLAKMFDRPSVNWRLKTEWEILLSDFPLRLGDIFPKATVPRSHWLETDKTK